MIHAPHLSDLALHYDALLCDVWGVIRGGRNDLYTPALDALVKFRAQGGTVVLLSNSPRRASSLISHPTQIGAPREAFDAAVSSGEATSAELKRRAPGPAYKLGPDFDDPLYAGAGLDFAALADARFISCTGLLDYETETPDDYQDLLREAAGLGLPMVCANPDIVVQLGDKLAFCAGSLAQLYDALGGETIILGKPNPPIYELAFKTLTDLRGRPVNKARVLAIGDGPATDLRGAMGAELDSLFIADGVVADQMRDGFSLERAKAILADEGVSATYAAPALVW